MNNLQIQGLSLGQLGTNCYVIYKDNQAIIIDPGGDSKILCDWLTKKELIPISILLTHAHFDHIGAVEDIRNHYQIPVYLHQAEEDWMEDPTLNGSGLFPVENVVCRPADYIIPIGMMEVGSFSFEVKHTPGHSPGGVSFIFADEKIVVSGDCLFENGIGRTDLPGGNHQQLINSIKEQLLTLGDSYKIYPGHGPMTTIEKEKKFNPFISV
ncbi:MBL fold metallo-hydrolase [Paraliobacillus quinghaiensis]|uniref:MBL fold metallo-hydrolase n=1 Tax=Paraliobacillus quinghaiensis TaxID=470815 RepID=UPI0027E5577C|nr:MBL fold metallo-hydrolase [Paraliobacillus quinghaiensis]